MAPLHGGSRLNKGKRNLNLQTCGSQRPGPLTHHDEVHVALVAERADKLRVLGVLAVLGQAAQTGRATVERLGAPASSFMGVEGGQAIRSRQQQSLGVAIRNSHTWVLGFGDAVSGWPQTTQARSVLVMDGEYDRI